jgi:hypothetical protein
VVEKVLSDNESIAHSEQSRSEPTQSVATGTLSTPVKVDTPIIPVHVNNLLEDRVQPLPEEAVSTGNNDNSNTASKASHISSITDGSNDNQNLSGFEVKETPDRMTSTNLITTKNENGNSIDSSHEIDDNSSNFSESSTRGPSSISVASTNGSQISRGTSDSTSSIMSDNDKSIQDSLKSLRSISEKSQNSYLYYVKSSKIMNDIDENKEFNSFIEKLAKINGEIENYKHEPQYKKNIDEFLSSVKIIENRVNELTPTIKKIDKPIQGVSGTVDRADEITKLIVSLKLKIETLRPISKATPILPTVPVQTASAEVRTPAERLIKRDMAERTPYTSHSSVSPTPSLTPSKRLMSQSQSPIIQALSEALKSPQGTPPSGKRLSQRVPLTQGPGTTLGGTKKRKIIQRSRKISRKK